MKSFIFINILLIILLSQYECKEDCAGSGTSKTDCNTRNLRDGEYRCCYYYWKFGGETNQQCKPLSQIEYQNFKEYIKTYEDIRKKADDFSFDCNSNYLILSMFWLFLLLLLF